MRMLLQPASLLLVLIPFVAQADDNWPQWRGPLLNGSTTTAKNLPVHWTETENVIWRTKLPSWSAATPIVWGDTIFVTSAEAGFQSTETVKGVLDDPVRGGPPSPLATGGGHGQQGGAQTEHGFAFASHRWPPRVDFDRKRLADLPRL